MRLTEAQLEAGCRAVATFLTPSFPDLTPHLQHRLSWQMREWLAPCLLLLPDGITAEEVFEGLYEEVFIPAATTFLLHRLRENEVLEEHSDQELAKRMSLEEVENSALHLAYLTGLHLEAVEKGENFHLLVRPGLPEELPEDWEDALEELLRGEESP